MTSKSDCKDIYSFSHTKTESEIYYVDNGLFIAFCVSPRGRDTRTETLDMSKVMEVRGIKQTRWTVGSLYFPPWCLMNTMSLLPQ